MGNDNSLIVIVIDIKVVHYAAFYIRVVFLYRDFLLSFVGETDFSRMLRQHSKFGCCHDFICLSICLSVCRWYVVCLSSVTRVYCDKTTEARMVRLSLLLKVAKFLNFSTVDLITKFQGLEALTGVRLIFDFAVLYLHFAVLYLGNGARYSLGYN